MSYLPLIVDTEWLAARLDDPNLRLLDATTYLQFAPEGGYKVYSGIETYEEGHIPGAVYADVYRVLSDPSGKFNFTLPSHEQFAETISNLGVGDNTYVVVYDQGIGPSAWASRVWWQLRYEGFDQVAVLEGGFNKWKAEGRAVSKEPGSYPKAVFSGQRRPELLATLEDVKRAMDDDSTILVNSLPPADYRGEINNYGRPGHIPSSINIFIGTHINPETNLLLNDDLLKANLSPHGVLDPDKKVITYCGGGIAATWNALVLAKLGKQAAVYDGSMTEWAADPSLPLVVVSE